MRNKLGMGRGRRSLAIRALLIAISSLLIVLSCGNSFSAADRGQDGNTAVLTLYMTTPDQPVLYPQTRTITPASLDGHYYQLCFTKGADTVNAVADTSPFIVRLSAGTWDISAKGWHSEDDAEALPDTPVLRGGGRITVSAAEVLNAQVVMYPLEDGEGTLRYEITFPGDTVSALLRVYALPGISTADPKLVEVVDLLRGASGTLNLGSGFYRIALDLTRGTGAAPSLVRKSEIAHIYDGKETLAAYTIIVEQFTQGNVFTTTAALKTFLAAQPENTADAPYMAAVTGLDLSSSAVTAALFDALGNKYTALDLRSSNGGTSKSFIASAMERTNGQYLVSLSLPDTIETIGNLSLAYCRSLQYIKLPGQLTAIGSSAFRECPLTSLEFPAGVVSIGESAFEGCKGLRKVDLSFLTLTSLGNYAFKRATSLENVKLPAAGMPGNRVPMNVFNECTALSTVILSPNLETIDYGAFQYCAALLNIELPLSLKTIGDYAFEGCTVFLPVIAGLVNLETLGVEAFQDCNALITVRLPPSLTTIGRWAFRGCVNLTLAEIPASLADKINFETFASCRLLQFKVGTAEPNDGLIWGDGVLQALPAAAGDYSIPEGIKKIAAGCFSGNSSLEKLTLPSTIIEIGAGALGSNITTMIVNAAVPPGAAANLSGASLTMIIYVPAASVTAYKTTLPWSAFAANIKSISEL